MELLLSEMLNKNAKNLKKNSFVDKSLITPSQYFVGQKIS
jgi:hypothetical protein